MTFKGNELIVVKVGSSSLTGRGGGIDRRRVESITRQLSGLHGRGYRVILVTSGAIAAGFRRLGFASRPRRIEDKQAAAAVGQALLMEEYNRAFSRAGIASAQILLTREDFSDKRRFSNAFAAMSVLLERGAVPIINENDTVSVDEVKIGDNDTLSAQVAAMMHADLLILLTDIDGLYTADPTKNPDARHIDTVDTIDDDVFALAGDTSSGVGTGGMITKLRGAALATEAGVEVFICSATGDDVLSEVIAGTRRGTRFTVKGRMHTRTQWLSFYAKPKGIVTVDAGAARALTEGKKSLLPAGILSCEGDFTAGDAVEVVSDGKVIGRGIVNYAREELTAIMGKHGNYTEAINRDNWAGGNTNA